MHNDAHVSGCRRYRWMTCESSAAPGVLAGGAVSMYGTETKTPGPAENPENKAQAVFTLCRLI